MTKADPAPNAAGGPRRFLPALFLLFAASGCSALIYEIVWYQLLQLVIGSTAVGDSTFASTVADGGSTTGSVTVDFSAKIDTASSSNAPADTSTVSTGRSGWTGA